MNFDKKNAYPSLFVKWILICVFLFCVFLPLWKMLSYTVRDDLAGFVQSSLFRESLLNSLLVSCVSTAASLSVAFLLAWCLSRTNVRLKGILSMVVVMPMLIPSISHSTGLIILFGKNGIITPLLGTAGNIYGFWGIVIGSVLYSFPFAFLMIVDILKYENYAPYEAARVLGIPPQKQFTAITFPYLRKPMIAVVFATFTMIFTDYGVPLAIGGKYTTLPVLMYQEVVGQLDFGKGSIIGMVLLFPALIAFIFDVINKDKTGNVYGCIPYKIQKNRTRDAIAYAICTAVSAFIVLLIAAFAVLAFSNKYPIDLSPTFNHIMQTFEMSGIRYLKNSIVIAMSVTAIGVFAGFVMAYLTARMQSKLSKSLHLMITTSLAIPGIVLGLSYVMFFKGSMIYGTIVILALVNLVHFIASPYMMMYNTLGKINQNLEGVGQTLGISRIRMILHVILPQVRSTLVEMGSYLFVNSMITISAVSFLATTANKPFSLMINQFEALMMLECSAVISLILLMINMTLKAIIYLVKRRISRKERESNDKNEFIEETV